MVTLTVLPVFLESSVHGTLRINVKYVTEIHIHQTFQCQPALHAHTSPLHGQKVQLCGTVFAMLVSRVLMGKTVLRVWLENINRITGPQHAFLAVQDFLLACRHQPSAYNAQSIPGPLKEVHWYPTAAVTQDFMSIAVCAIHVLQVHIQDYLDL